MMPEIDEMLITEPPRRAVCFLISETPCLQPRKTPSRSMACTRRHSSRVMSSTVLPSPMPAEFRSTCRAPNLSAVSRLAAFQLSSLATSRLTQWPAPPTGDRLAAVGGDIGHDYAGAFLGHQDGGIGAQPRGAPGDQRDLAFQAIGHFLVLPASCASRWAT